MGGPDGIGRTKTTAPIRPTADPGEIKKQPAAFGTGRAKNDAFVSSKRQTTAKGVAPFNQATIKGVNNENFINVLDNIQQDISDGKLDNGAKSIEDLGKILEKIKANDSPSDQEKQVAKRIETLMKDLGSKTPDIKGIKTQTVELEGMVKFNLKEAIAPSGEQRGFMSVSPDKGGNYKAIRYYSKDGVMWSNSGTRANGAHENPIKFDGSEPKLITNINEVPDNISPPAKSEADLVFDLDLQKNANGSYRRAGFQGSYYTSKNSDGTFSVNYTKGGHSGLKDATCPTQIYHDGKWHFMDMPFAKKDHQVKLIGSQGGFTSRRSDINAVRAGNVIKIPKGASFEDSSAIAPRAEASRKSFTAGVQANATLLGKINGDKDAKPAFEALIKGQIPQTPSSGNKASLQDLLNNAQQLAGKADSLGIDGDVKSTLDSLIKDLGLLIEDTSFNTDPKEKKIKDIDDSLKVLIEDRKDPQVVDGLKAKGITSPSVSGLVASGNKTGLLNLATALEGIASKYTGENAEAMKGILLDMAKDIKTLAAGIEDKTPEPEPTKSKLQTDYESFAEEANKSIKNDALKIPTDIDVDGLIADKDDAKLTKLLQALTKALSDDGVRTNSALIIKAAQLVSGLENAVKDAGGGTPPPPPPPTKTADEKLVDSINDLGVTIVASDLTDLGKLDNLIAQLEAKGDPGKELKENLEGKRRELISSQLTKLYEKDGGKFKNTALQGIIDAKGNTSPEATTIRNVERLVDADLTKQTNQEDLLANISELITLLEKETPDDPAIKALEVIRDSLQDMIPPEDLEI